MNGAHSRSPARRALTLSLAGLALLAAVWLALALSGGPDRRPQHATVLPDGLPLPTFSLTDQDGRPFTRDALEGRWSLLFFGFANCPDICPITLSRLAAARRRLAEDSPGSVLPQIVFISVDPDRDTIDALAEYVGAFGGAVTGATAPEAELRVLAEPLGIYFRKGPGGADYAVEHSSSVLLVNPDAELHAIIGAPQGVDQLAGDLALILPPG